MIESPCVGPATDGQRDAQQLKATMDHADIRGLATALHRSVAGLPRSRVGDHPVRCPHSSAEGSPHRVPASRCRSVVYADYLMGVFSGISWLCRLAASIHVLTDAPDKARQFSCDRHTDLVVLHAARGQL